jgi:hypothetical protein
MSSAQLPLFDPGPAAPPRQVAVSKWIRFMEPPIGGLKAVPTKRYHAVWAETDGGYWTFCQRFIRATAVKESTDSPPARCSGCRSRLLHPYLIPDQLLAMRGQSV